VDQDDETYLIKVAMLRKAVELRTEEIKATASLTAQAISQFMLA
jgi:hypothetical protein